MKRLVIFNAPPNSGKDYICNFLSNNYYTHHVEFKESLREIVKSIYNLTGGELEFLSIRDHKENKYDTLGGKSIREVFIEVSEELIKPFYGSDFFAKHLVDDLRHTVLNVCSDGGFVEEIEYVAESIGKENLLIIQIHADGCSFENDSRNYVAIDGVKTYTVHNNKDEQFIVDVLDILNKEEML